MKKVKTFQELIKELSNNRTIKELLEVMLNHQEQFDLGFCMWIRNLHHSNIINQKEYYLLYSYLQANRPSKYSSLSAYRNRYSGYFWFRGEISPRINWIKKHIKKLS